MASAIKAKFDSLKAENESLSERLYSSEQSVKELQATINRLEGENQSLSNKLNFAEESLNRAQDHRSGLVSDAKMYEMRADEAERKCANFQAKIEKLEFELDEQKARAITLKEEMDAMVAELNQL